MGNMTSSSGQVEDSSSRSSKILGKVMKVLAPSTISQQTTEAVAHAVHKLQEYLDWQGVPEQTDLQATLYNPQKSLCEGFQAQAKITNEAKRQQAKIRKVFSLAVLASSYKLVHMKYTKLPNIENMVKGFLVVQLINMIDTITFEVSKCTEIFQVFRVRSLHDWRQRVRHTAQDLRQSFVRGAANSRFAS